MGKLQIHKGELPFMYTQESDGVKFHYVEAGDKSKPLVLLLHGFPDCWLTWRKQIPCLAEHYRVVAIDLKGFGDCDKPLNGRSYKIEILIDELKQFILILGVKTCNIIGHDLGGLLEWYKVTLHRDIVYKFVAISSPHPNFYWNRVSRNSALDKKWIHFSRLPFLPEIDALKEDLSIIINDIFQHLQISQDSTEKSYIEAYKYAFSRKGRGEMSRAFYQGPATRDMWGLHPLKPLSLNTGQRTTVTTHGTHEVLLHMPQQSSRSRRQKT
ncbi:epoxide hydrolase 3-like isoform X3 [Temnothorax nylanderi]|uniref:epoxide hydrolase 3-like isoform X3 n=1 Tax=Temnothorax nylanderi TaxID=102681 RepID=UPI003A8AD1F3